MKLKLFNYLVLILLVITLVNAQEEFFVSPLVMELTTEVGATSEEIIQLQSTNTIVNIEVSQNLQGIIDVQNTINLQGEEDVVLEIKAPETPGIYSGFITIKNNAQEKIIHILIDTDQKKKEIDLNLDLPIKKVSPRDKINADLDLVNLGNFQPLKLTINAKIKDFNGLLLSSADQVVIINKELLVPIKIDAPIARTGTYFLEIEAISATSIEKTAQTFTITSNLEESQQLTPNYPSTSLILILLVSLVVLYFLIRLFRKKRLRKAYILLLILFIAVAFVTLPSLLKEEETPKVPSFGNAIDENITKQLGISDLTNEPFLRNVTEEFVIYIIDSTQINEQNIKVDSTEDEFIISLGNIRLEISKSGRKYDFKIISKSTTQVECNLLCIWKLVFLTETIIVLLAAAVLIFWTHKKHTKEKVIVQEEDERSRILNLISLAESKLNRKDTSKTIKLFFVELLNLEYEATIEQLIKEISNTKLKQKLKDNITNLLNNVNEFEYSPTTINKKSIVAKFKFSLSSIKELYENQYKDKNFNIKRGDK